MKQVLNAEGYELSFEELEIVIESCIRRALYPNSIPSPKVANLIPLNKAAQYVNASKWRFAEKAAGLGITAFNINGRFYFSEYQLNQYLETIKKHPYMKRF